MNFHQKLFLRSRVPEKFRESSPTRPREPKIPENHKKNRKSSKIDLLNLKLTYRGAQEEFGAVLGHFKRALRALDLRSHPHQRPLLLNSERFFMKSENTDVGVIIFASGFNLAV